MIKHLATLAALSLLIPMIAAAEPEVEDKPAKFFLLTLEPLPATIFGLDALYSIFGTYFLFVYWRLTCRRLKSQPTPLRRPFNYLFGTSFLFFVYCILESLALPAAFGEKGKDFALPALVVLDFEVHLMDISFVVAFFLVLANLGTYNARVLGFTWTGKSPVDYALVGSLVLMQLGSVILSATKKALAYGASRWPVGLGSCYTVFVGLYLAASLVIWGKAMDLRKLVAQNRGSHTDVTYLARCMAPVLVARAVYKMLMLVVSGAAGGSMELTYTLTVLAQGGSAAVLLFMFLVLGNRVEESFVEDTRMNASTKSKGSQEDAC